MSFLKVLAECIGITLATFSPFILSGVFVAIACAKDKRNQKKANKEARQKRRDKEIQIDYQISTLYQDLLLNEIRGN